MMKTILLTDNIQDEAILTQILRFANFSIRTTQTLDQVLRNWNSNPADLIVTAIQFTDIVAAVRQIRYDIIVPLVVIVESLTEEMHVQTIEAGVDLVLSRPYSARLLISYTKNLVSLTDSVHRLSPPPINAHRFTLDPASRTVHIPNKEAQRLTQLEFRLLHILISNKNQVLPLELIIERVWGYTGEGDNNMVRNLIYRLRAKVEIDHKPFHIATVPGIGYMFQDGDDSSHPTDTKSLAMPSQI